MDSPNDRPIVGTPSEPLNAGTSTTDSTTITTAAETGDEIMFVVAKRSNGKTFIPLQSLVDLARRGKRPMNRAGIENN